VCTELPDIASIGKDRTSLDEKDMDCAVIKSVLCEFSYGIVGFWFAMAGVEARPSKKRLAMNKDRRKKNIHQDPIQTHLFFPHDGY
jgi:hypothetical protein